MGCATSKQKERLCSNCHGPCSPPIPRRSYSLHRHSNPPDGHHIVSFTSSSLDPFKLDSFRETKPKEKMVEKFSVGLIEPKTWSRMIDERIPMIVPMTPIRTPPGEPENINVWELMEGLDDISPLRPGNHLRSFSFHLGPNLVRDEADEPRELFYKPRWLELADKEIDSKNLEFDSNVLSTFRDAIEQDEKSTGISKESKRNIAGKGNADDVTETNLEPMESTRNYETKKKLEENISEETTIDEVNLGTNEKVKNRVVLYFTSLRGVRKTYEDCCHVRVILKSIGVRIDERDVSMHSGFKEELKNLLGNEFSTSPLPRVFLGGNYIGGAEEIGQLHEEGRLERMLLDEGDVATDGGVGDRVCEACGDVRFVPCEKCSGSCKIYYGDEYNYDYNDDQYEAKECDESECGFKKCHDCNENGLVRCPICCD